MPKNKIWQLAEYIGQGEFGQAEKSEAWQIVTAIHILTSILGMRKNLSKIC